MMESMRNAAKSWVAKLLIGLLAVSFGVWGIADVFRNGGGTTLAHVGSAEISAHDVLGVLYPDLADHHEDVDGAHPVAVGLSIVDLVERIQVPGATTSGLIRPSAVGPRLENATTWSGLSAIGASLYGATG